MRTRPFYRLAVVRVSTKQEKKLLTIQFDTQEEAVAAINVHATPEDAYYLTAVGGKYGPIGKILRKRAPHTEKVAEQLVMKLGKPTRKKVYDVVGKGTNSNAVPTF